MAKILNTLIDFARTVNGKVDELLAGAQKTDTLFIAGFVVAAILLSLFLKRRKIIILSVSIYIVTALYQALPFEWGMAYGNNVWIFLGAVAVIFFLLKSSIASGFYGGGGGDYAGRTKVFLLSFITLGFLVSSALNFVTDIQILDNIKLIDRLFSGDVSKAIWAFLPLVGFLFLRH